MDVTPSFYSDGNLYLKIYLENEKIKSKRNQMEIKKLKTGECRGEALGL